MALQPGSPFLRGKLALCMVSNFYVHIKLLVSIVKTGNAVKYKMKVMNPHPTQRTLHLTITGLLGFIFIYYDNHERKTGKNPTRERCTTMKS